MWNRNDKLYKNLHQKLKKMFIINFLTTTGLLSIRTAIQQEFGYMKFTFIQLKGQIFTIVCNKEKVKSQEFRIFQKYFPQKLIGQIWIFAIRSEIHPLVDGRKTVFILKLTMRSASVVIRHVSRVISSCTRPKLCMWHL